MQRTPLSGAAVAIAAVAIAATAAVAIVAVPSAAASPVAGEAPPHRVSDFFRPIGEVARYGFSPDGSMLILSVDHQLRDFNDVYTVPVDGDAAQAVWLGRIGRFAGLPRFTPDGGAVVFVTSDGTLVAADPVGGLATPLFTPPPGGRVSGVLPIPGDVVVFLRRDAEDADTKAFAVPVAGGALTQLSQLPSGWNAGAPVASSDGAHVAYFGSIARPVRIEVVPIGGGAPVLLSHALQPTERITGLAFTPDNSRVIYQVARAATPNLFYEDIYSIP
ncbi:MAG: hypothetical protein AAFY88_21590, partial [Acidobacteriota bacterium]